VRLTGSILALLLIAAGCKADGDDSDTADRFTCAACAPSELCVENIDEGEPDAGFITCEPVPEGCADGLDCNDNSCLVEAYATCGVGFEAARCDADEAPNVTCFAEGAEPPEE
jgi:hypothetical protein